MKKNRYQHLIVSALISMALLQGSLDASDENYGRKGERKTFCQMAEELKLEMEARDIEKNNREKAIQEEGQKCLEILITIPRRALEGFANYLAPERPATFFERVTTRVAQARNAPNSFFH